MLSHSCRRINPPAPQTPPRPRPGFPDTVTVSVVTPHSGPDTETRGSGDCSTRADSARVPGAAGGKLCCQTRNLCRGVLARSSQDRANRILPLFRINKVCCGSTDLLREFEPAVRLVSPINCTDLHQRHGSYTFNAKFWLGSIATMASTRPSLPGRTM